MESQEERAEDQVCPLVVWGGSTCRAEPQILPHVALGSDPYTQISHPHSSRPLHNLWSNLSRMTCFYGNFLSH